MALLGGVVALALTALPTLEAKSSEDTQPADPQLYAKLERENNVLVVQCRDGEIQTTDGMKNCQNLAPRDISFYAWTSESTTMQLPMKRGNDAQTFWTALPPSAWGGTFKADNGWVYNGTVEWFDNSGAVYVQGVGANGHWYGYSFR
jgi:hypothetical protein